MNPNTVVIYHRADFDGIFCREIAKKFLPEATFLGWDYGDPTPTITDDCDIYMLDISIDALMARKNLVWIDHHKSAIDKFTPEVSSGEKYEGRFGHQIKGYRIDGVAACRLAWQWFKTMPEHAEPNFAGRGIEESLPSKQQFIDRSVSEPWAVRLAGEYDIWDKRDPDAELFQHGLSSRDLSNYWGLMLTLPSRGSIDEIEALVAVGHRDILNVDGTQKNPIVVGLLKDGKVIQHVQSEQNASIIKAYGFTVKFEGLTFLACNHARFNSLLFTAGLKSEHDALLGFNWSGKDWRISLYHAPGKERHDLSLIASKYGGGGHRGACGFRMETCLPWLPC